MNKFPFRALEGTINIVVGDESLQCENPFPLNGNVYATIIGVNRKPCEPHTGCVIDFEDHEKSVEWIDKIKMIPFWQCAEFWCEFEETT